MGPKAIRYLLLAICFMFAGYMLVMLFPIITGNLMTRIFTGWYNNIILRNIIIILIFILNNNNIKFNQKYKY